MFTALRYLKHSEIYFPVNKRRLQSEFRRKRRIGSNGTENRIGKRAQ